MYLNKSIHAFEWSGTYVWLAYYFALFKHKQLSVATVWRKDYLTYLNSARIAIKFFYTVIKIIYFYSCCMCNYQYASYMYLLHVSLQYKEKNTNTTLCGGSLGSRVDEERSKLRELMWFAGHIDHRYLERILRLRIASVTTPVWGSVFMCKNVKVF